MQGLRQLVDVLNIETARLSGDPQRLQLALGESESRKLQQADNLINAEIDKLNIPETQKVLLKAIDTKSKADYILGGEKRRIVKGADGFQYYADTGERVLPGVVKAEETDRKIVKGADGFQYYADTGERVLPGVEQAAKKYDMKQDAAGYWRYTEGPQKGERVFVDVEKPDPLPDIKDESALRKEFNSQSTYFKGIAQSFGKILATDPTAAGDVSLIFAYMKMLDPTSVVREGEQATAREAEGIPGRILNLYNRAVTGESLTPDQRADFRKQAQNIYDLAFEDQSLNLARYTDIAKRKGFDPDVIVFDYSKGIEPKIFEDSLRRKTLLDLQNLDATQYTEEQLEILAQVLSEKLQPNQ